MIKLSYRSFKVWQRNWDAFLKYYYVNLVGSLGDPVLYLVAMGVGMGGLVGQINGISYLQFLAPGIIISSAMFSATYECTYESYLKMIYLKTYDAVIATPVSIYDVVAGDILWGASKAFLSAMIMFLAVALFGLVHSPMSLFIPILILIVGFHFASLAMLVTSFCPNFDFFNYFLELGITPMFFFSGIFFPLSQFPNWVAILAQFFPLTHAVELSRALILGQTLQPLLLHLAILILPTLGLFYWSLARMKQRIIK